LRLQPGEKTKAPARKMLSPTQLAFLVGLPLCDCFGGELFAVILHPFGFASHSACTDDNAAKIKYS